MRDATARQLEPREPMKSIRLQLRDALTCWRRHALRGRNVRWLKQAVDATSYSNREGAIATCLTCGENVLVSGSVLCDDGRWRYLTHRLTQDEFTAIVKQRARSITEILAILALD